MRVVKILLLFLLAAFCGVGVGWVTFSLTHPSQNLNLLSKPTPLPSVFTTAPSTLAPSPTATNSASPSAQPLKKFVVTASNYRFFPTEIRVKKDDKVQISLRNISGLHNINISDFSVFSTTIEQNKTTQVEFIADTKGAYKFYCGVEDHQQLGMTGKLIVE